MSERLKDCALAELIIPTRRLLIRWMLRYIRKMPYRNPARAEYRSVGGNKFLYVRTRIKRRGRGIEIYVALVNQDPRECLWMHLDTLHRMCVAA